jgi:hypothetical protein
VYFTAGFMKLLLAGVFAFFGLHTALWFPRELRALRQRRAAARGPAGGRAAGGTDAGVGPAPAQGPEGRSGDDA